MPPSARLEAVNPFDQKLICTLNCDDERAIDWKIGRAQAAFERWRRVPLAERVERVAAAVAVVAVVGAWLVYRRLHRS